ncbi:MAG: 2-oxoacid ferredoxin oxidoreductase [Candidatus Kerfeldbacteria bacterium]|nr:2-oxoacid ferredoxin oxidoreductase [Candidatus Kerfeldbacteria bacterium]
MTDIQKFETSHAPTWCSGCGDFGIWRALKLTLVRAKLEPHDVAVVYGIGCSGNMADKLRVYGFHGLHGRALPAAEGIKLANHRLPVIVVGGDGDGYGEGMGHFIHTIRGNHDLTYIVHNNAVYGLTKGQTAPTSPKGFKTNSTPAGSIEEPVNPLALAIAADATFVARGFSGDVHHLSDLMLAGMNHRGFALIDVLQPCVSFNHLNTYDYYRARLSKLEQDKNYNPTDRSAAFTKALEWGDRIPVGIFFKSEDRPAFHEELPQLAPGPLVDRPVDQSDPTKLFGEFY